MKKTLLILLVVLVSFNNYAQDGEADIAVDIKTSEVFKDKTKYTSLDFSTKDKNGGVILGRRYKKGYFIEHYDASMKLVGSFDYEDKKKRGAFLSAFISDNELVLIEFYNNKPDKTLDYYVHKSPIGSFNFKRKLLISVPKKEVSKISPWSLSKIDSDRLGEVTVSPNQDYVSITLDVIDNEKETHLIYMFDNKLNKVYQTEFVRDIKDRRFRLENVDIDEKDGTVYLLGKAYTREKKKKKNGGKYQFELYKINGSTQKSVVFDSGDKYIGSLTTIVNDDKVVCVGFYSEKKDFRYKGFSYFDVDPGTMKLSSAKYSPFTEQFIQDKYGKSKDKELRNISFRDILLTGNGEIIINAEEFFITTVQSATPNGGFYTSYRYNYRDIISAKISATGDLIWARNINKKQIAGYASPYLSYTSTYANDKVYIFVNSADKVRRIRADRLQFKGTKAKKSNLYVITINAEGIFEYKKILDDKDSEVPFSAGRGYLNDEGDKVLFQGRRRNKKQILKLSI